MNKLLTMLVTAAVAYPSVALACSLDSPTKGHGVGLKDCPQDVTDFVLAADMCRPAQPTPNSMEQRLSDSDPKSAPCEVTIEFDRQRDELLAKYKDDATVLPTLEAAINIIFNKK